MSPHTYSGGLVTLSHVPVAQTEQIFGVLAFPVPSASARAWLLLILLSSETSSLITSSETSAMPLCPASFISTLRSTMIKHLRAEIGTHNTINRREKVYNTQKIPKPIFKKTQLYGEKKYKNKRQRTNFSGYLEKKNAFG